LSHLSSSLTDDTSTLAHLPHPPHAPLPLPLLWSPPAAKSPAGVIASPDPATSVGALYFVEGVVKLPAVIAYGEVATFSPTARVRLVAVEVKPLSLIATLPFQVTTAGLVISPPRVTPTVPSAGSSAPDTLASLPPPPPNP